MSTPTTIEPSFSTTFNKAPVLSNTSIAVGFPEISITDRSPFSPIASKQTSKIGVPFATLVPFVKSSVNHENVISPGLGLPIFEAAKFAKFRFTASA